MAFDRNINFILGQGGLGTPQPGYDYISGFVFNSSTLPSGFSASVAKQVFSVGGAEALGILGDYSGETKASVGVTMSTLGAIGDTINIKVTEPSPNGGNNVVNFGTYTVSSTDTLSTVASNVASMISISDSGYTATAASTKVTITARPGLGNVINSVTPTITVTGTMAATTLSFAGGVSDVRKLEHYQISEFFRLNPTGVLWIMYYTGSNDFSKINLLQQQSGNSIRQFGVYEVGATSSSLINSSCDVIQAQGNLMMGYYSPASVIYAPNLYNVSDLSTLSNLRSRSCNFVSVVIGQDGGNLGAWLSLYGGQSVPCYGAVLGLVSSAKVSEDIGWVGKYNLVTGNELVKPAFSNKSLYSSLYSSSYNLINQLDGYGYIFAMTRPNLLGAWVNDSHCAISKTSDYAFIERNRTIDKVLRNSYAELAPLVNSPLLLKADGTLSEVARSIFIDAEKPGLDSMVQAGEISAYEIIIDPTQNVQSTSTINVAIKIVGVGVARNIVVTLGYVLSI